MGAHSILEYIWSHPASSKSDIKTGTSFPGSDATLKRILAEAVDDGFIYAEGKGRATKYFPRKYPDGVQTFEKIRRDGYIYIDKTPLVFSLANRESACVFLSRPRRFGKSLLISTLEAYFKGRKDLFTGLAIEKLEKKWEEFPVVRIDMSTAADAFDKDQLYLKLGNILRECEESMGLEADETLPGERLYSLVKRAYEKTGKPVVLLIDEYDAPILGALYDDKREDDFRLIVKELFSPIKKLDPYLRFTFLSGITKFCQLSIFSTLNNLNDISLDDKYSSICGFTEEEVETVFKKEIQLLSQSDEVSYSDMLLRLKQYYDGYHFGPSCCDIYNPFSILRAFSNIRISNYWFSSGTPTLLYNTLKLFNTDIYDIDGAEVKESVFSQPSESVTNALSLFYQSGYLTIKSYHKDTDTYVLGIPNAEVRSGLMDNLLPAATGKSPIETQNVAVRFKRALLENNPDKALEVLKGFFASIPYPEFGASGNSFESKESYFKRLFYTVFSFMNVQIYTEVMNSEGRTDAVMYLGDTIYVIEAKLDSTPEAALEQIDKKGYTTRFAGTKNKIVCMGLNFSSKTRTLESWKLI